MAPTPVAPGGIQISPYQQALIQQAQQAQQAQAAGAPGSVGLGPMLDIGATLAGARALGGVPATAPAAIAPAAGATGRSLAPGKAGALLASPLGRAGLYGAGGYAAGQISNKIVGEHNDTSADEALTGALTGAGVGAGIGSVVPGVGTLAGGVVGGAIGGALGYFGPKDKGVGPANQELARQLASVDKLAAESGLNEQARAALAAQLQAARAGVGSKAEMKAAGAQVAALVPQLQAQAQADEMQRSRALAYQAAMAPLLAQVLNRSAGSAREQQAMMEQAAGSVSGPLADAYRARGAAYVADADQANAALAQQAMLAGAPQPGGQQALMQQLLAQQGQARQEQVAKKGSGIKDLGQFITGTGVTDNLVQLYTMQMLMGAKGGRSVGSTAGGV